MGRIRDLIQAVYVLILLSLNGCSPAFAQTIHYARVIPGETRTVWVVGRDLWVGNEHLYDASTNAVRLSIGGTDCEWDLLEGANGEEPNRAWPYAQRFAIPASIPAGDYTIEHTRNDGAKTQFTVRVSASRRIGWPLVLTGVSEVDGTISVNPGQTMDLGGKVITPSAKYTGGENLVIVGQGATLINGGVYVHEGCPAAIKNAVLLVGTEHMLANLDIQNHRLMEEKDKRRGGYAVFVDDTSGSYFINVKTIGARHWENDPRDKANGNTWCRCEASGWRLGRDSQIGRGIVASKNLIINTCWHDMDRGSTGSQYGSPVDQCVFYECRQYNTGRSILGDGLKDAGASEGTLIETASNYLGFGQCGGNVCIITSTSPDDKLFIRPGYHVALMEKKVWARITSINSSAGDSTKLVLTVDRQLPIGNYTCRIGNLACECSFLRCQFEHGRAGIWLHGASVSTAIIQCDFIDLRHTGVVKLERDKPGMQCFHWGLDAKYLSSWNTSNLWRDYTP